MTEIRFSAEQKADLVQRLQAYFDTELDQELKQFDAEFLLDFIARELGVHYYNQGLFDAQAALSNRLDSLTEAIDELEKPLPSRR